MNRRIKSSYRYGISFENKFVTRENSSSKSGQSRNRNKKKPKILPLQIPKLSLRILSNSSKKRKKRDSIKFSLPIPSILGPFVSSPLVDEIHLEYPSAIARGGKSVVKNRSRKLVGRGKYGERYC